MNVSEATWVGVRRVIGPLRFASNALRRATMVALPAMVLVCVVAIIHTGMARADEGRPKLGPDAVTIQQSHDYLQSHAAPDYWSLSPFYLPQATGSACSVAAIAMLIMRCAGCRPATRIGW